MVKKKGKIAKRMSILGLTAMIALAGLTFTGCSEELKNAQNKIDSNVTAVLNGDEQLREKYNNSKFSDFVFLCSDVEQNANNKYDVDINGIVSINTDKKQKAYTTLKYLVDGKYFDGVDKKSYEQIINTLASIVQNENFKSVSVEEVSDVKALNKSMSIVTESPIDGYNMNKNFLYGVGNVRFDDINNVAAFSTKEASKFTKTTFATSFGFIGTNKDGTPKYGLVTTPKTENKTFFLEHNVYIKLTPEELKAAKGDHTIIFDKFNEYVKNKDKDNYVIQDVNVKNEKDFSANMIDEVVLE